LPTPGAQQLEAPGRVELPTNGLGIAREHYVPLRINALAALDGRFQRRFRASLVIEV